MRVLFVVDGRSPIALNWIAHFVDHGHFKSFNNSIDLGLFDGEDINTELISDEEAQKRENLISTIRFLSLFAQICRSESRCEGSLVKFFAAIKQLNFTDNTARKILSYLLYIGEDIFSFYLLLWELAFTADCDPERMLYVRN